MEYRTTGDIKHNLPLTQDTGGNWIHPEGESAIAPNTEQVTLTSSLWETLTSIPHLTSALSPEVCMQLYHERLFASLALWLGMETGCKRLETVMDFLTVHGFFKAPASTKYHEAFEGGLCLHSLKVLTHAMSLAGTFAFKAVNKPQAAVVALLHDLVKVDQYEPYDKNIKDSVTGKWVTERAYRYNNTKDVLLGHGETSMVLAKKLIPELTIEMLTAIRWHMGLWDCADTNKGDFSAACSKYPMVHLIQFADQLSVTAYANSFTYACTAEL